MIGLLAVLFTSCDISDDDACGKTFNESELNDTIATANNFNIILKISIYFYHKLIMNYH